MGPDTAIAPAILDGDLTSLLADRQTTSCRSTGTCTAETMRITRGRPARIGSRHRYWRFSASVSRSTEIPQSRSPKLPSCPWGGEGHSECRSALDDHPLPDELGDGNRLVTAGARAPDADLAHEGATVDAALLSEGSGPACVALVDGDRSPRLASRHRQGQKSLVSAPSIRRRPAGVGAEALAPSGREGLLAHRTGHRDAIVTRRELTVLFVTGSSPPAGTPPHVRGESASGRSRPRC
jgi:hypothetical protein